MQTPTGPATRLPLRGGIEIPVLGLGVFRTPARSTARAVRAALRAGYRHIDTAEDYGNEVEVAAGIRTSGLDPAQVFITTKLGDRHCDYTATLEAFEGSRRRLGVDVVDLYLLRRLDHSPRLHAWRAAEFLLKRGKVRAIGVANYTASELNALLSVAECPPAVNQIEVNPYTWASHRHVLRLCAEKKIAVEACSPLTRGRLLAHPALVAIAEACGKSSAQVLIRWAMQKGLIVLPKSAHPERIAANADVFDFVLSQEHMLWLDAFYEGP